MGVQKGEGLQQYYKGKIEELELLIKDKSHNLRRLEAQRNELNTQGARGLEQGPPCTCTFARTCSGPGRR